MDAFASLSSDIFSSLNLTSTIYFRNTTRVPNSLVPDDDRPGYKLFAMVISRRHLQARSYLLCVLFIIKKSFIMYSGLHILCKCIIFAAEGNSSLLLNKYIYSSDSLRS